MLPLIALLALAYVCGSIPTGVWVSRRRGVDPRDIGSGNIGATNVTRAAGPAAGLVTLGGDVLKGVVPVALASRLGYGEPAAALVGFAAFAGHLYSCFLGFDGGKGVATALGVFLGVAPAVVGVALAIFGATLAIARYVSLASIVAAASVPPLLLVFGHAPSTIGVGTAIAALVVVRHRDNIRRLRCGTEPRLGRVRGSAIDADVA
jgi:glycerol-3-phosphate acyltransferase PlsY